MCASGDPDLNWFRKTGPIDQRVIRVNSLSTAVLSRYQIIDVSLLSHAVRLRIFIHQINVHAS